MHQGHVSGTLVQQPFRFRWFVAAVCLILCSTPINLVGQEQDIEDAPAMVAQSLPDAKEADVEKADAKLVKEIEPGVLLIGKTHRFAEVGDCDSFAVSPDGKTLICAGSKIKFFDLDENVVREEIGKDGEHYQQVEFSPDGRYILGSTYLRGESMVRVWDAVDLSVVSAVPCKAGIGDQKGFESFYVQKVYVSPDSNFYCATTYNSAIVRDLRTGELVQTFRGLQYIQCAAFSLDESQLYLPFGGRVQAFDLDSGEQVPVKDSKLGMVAQFIDVNLSRELIAATSGRTIRIKDLGGDQPDRVLNLPTKTYGQSVVFSDDGSLVAVGVWRQGGESGNGFGLVVLDCDSGKVIKEVSTIGQNVGRIRFSTDREKIYFAGPGVFGINEALVHGEDEVADDKFPISPAIANAVHPNMKSLLSCSSAGELNVFDLDSGEIVKSFRHGSPRNLALTADGSQVIVDSCMGIENVSVYGYESGEKIKDVSVKSAKGSLVSGLRNFMTKGSPSSGYHQAYPIGVSLSHEGTHFNALVLDMRYKPSGGTFMASELDQTFKLKFMTIDAESGNVTSSKSFALEDFGYGQNQWVQVGAVSANSSRFLVARQSGIVCADGETGEVVFEIDCEGSVMQSGLKFSPDGKCIAAAVGRGVSIWDAESGELISKLETEAGQSRFGFSGNGKRIAVCGRHEQSHVKVFSTESWKPVFERQKTQGNRNAISLSNNGQLVVFGLSDCRLEVWDLAKLK